MVNERNRRSHGQKAPPRQFNIHHSKFIIRARRARAGNRVRTGDLNLGKVALYQLSYARNNCDVECLILDVEFTKPLLLRTEGALAPIQHSSFNIRARSARPQRSHGESNPGLHLERVAS